MARQKRTHRNPEDCSLLGALANLGSGHAMPTYTNPGDPRVEAIRSDKRVGRFTCTSIDECWGDTELVRALDKAGAMTPEAAIAWAYEREGMFLERGLNQRWGEDDDPQLLAYRAWNEKS